MTPVMWVIAWSAWGLGYINTIAWLCDKEVLERAEDLARSLNWSREFVFLAVMITFVTGVATACVFGVLIATSRYICWNLRGRP